MALISADILSSNPGLPPESIEAANTILNAAGVTNDPNKTLKDKLRDANLSTEDCLSIVSSVARFGESDALRLRAAEMALNMNGDLKKEADKPIPVVSIVIKDSQSIDVNPILIPRT